MQHGGSRPDTASFTTTNKGAFVRIYSLVELLLLVAAFHTVLRIDATGVKLWITLPCLVIVLAIERFRSKQIREKKVAQRLKNFSSADLRQRMQAQDKEQYYRS